MSTALFSALSLGRFDVTELRKAAMVEGLELTERFDVPHVLADGKTPVPEDLRNTRGRFFRLRNGFRSAGRLLDGILNFGAPSPALPLLFALLPLCAGMSSLFLGVPVVAPLFNLIAVLDLLILFFTVPMMWVVCAFVFGLLLPVAGSAVASQSQVIVGQMTGMSMSAFMPLLYFVAGVVVLSLFHKTRQVAQLALGVAAFFAAVIFIARFLPGPLQSLAFYAAGCALPYVYAQADFRRYVRSLAIQGQQCTLESTGPALDHIRGRQMQAEAAAQDTTKFIPLGRALGVFAAKMDPWATDKGSIFGLTQHDATVHVLVTGRTGSGKTFSIAYPIGKAAIETEKMGLLVMDAKESLPTMFKHFPGFQLLSPDTVTIGLYEGMSPLDIADGYAAVGSKIGNGEQADFWVGSAKEMTRHCLVLLEALIAAEKACGAADADRVWHKTPHDHAGLLARGQQDNPASQEAMKNYFSLIRAHVPQASDPTSLLSDTIAFWESTVPGMPDQTRGGIFQQANLWVSGMLNHEGLRKWTHSETGVKIEEVMTGAKMGLQVPAAKYGSTARVIQSVLKQRFARGILERGETDGKWRETDQCPVTLMVDEAHDLVGKGSLDTTLLPIARSLGCSCVYLTQSLEAFEVALGSSVAAHAFTANFVNRFAFQSTQGTGKWMQAFLGTTLNLRREKKGVGIDFESSAQRIAESPLFDPGQSTAFRRYARKLLRLGAAAVQPLNELPGATDTSETSPLLKHTSALGGQWVEEPLMSDADFDRHTATSYVCVAQVMRGGMRRRDFISTERKAA